MQGRHISRREIDDNNDCLNGEMCYIGMFVLGLLGTLTLAILVGIYAHQSNMVATAVPQQCVVVAPCFGDGPDDPKPLVEASVCGTKAVANDVDWGTKADCRSTGSQFDCWVKEDCSRYIDTDPDTLNTMSILFGTLLGVWLVLFIAGAVKFFNWCCDNGSGSNEETGDEETARRGRVRDRYPLWTRTLQTAQATPAWPCIYGAFCCLYFICIFELVCFAWDPAICSGSGDVGQFHMSVYAYNGSSIVKHDVYGNSAYYIDSGIRTVESGYPCAELNSTIHSIIGTVCNSVSSDESGVAWYIIGYIGVIMYMMGIKSFRLMPDTWRGKCLLGPTYGVYLLCSLLYVVGGSLTACQDISGSHGVTSTLVEWPIIVYAVLMLIKVCPGVLCGTSGLVCIMLDPEGYLNSPDAPGNRDEPLEPSGNLALE